MLAILLHRRPRPSLGIHARLAPIVDWRAGRVQVREWLKWHKQHHYMTLVRIPDDHPVRIGFGRQRVKVS